MHYSLSPCQGLFLNGWILVEILGFLTVVYRSFLMGFSLGFSDENQQLKSKINEMLKNGCKTRQLGLCYQGSCCKSEPILFFTVININFQRKMVFKNSQEERKTGPRSNNSSSAVCLIHNDLESDTTYYFCVRAFNLAGESNTSEIVNCRTLNQTHIEIPRKYPMDLLTVFNKKKHISNFICRLGG